jgi:outer membrane protein
MKIIISSVFALLGVAVFSSAWAVDLSAVYLSAQKHNRQLMAAHSEDLSEQAKAKMAYALWLPKVTWEASVTQGNFTVDEIGEKSSHDSMAFSIEQTLFSIPAFKELAESRYAKKFAQLNYQKEKEQVSSLIVTDYFDVLLAKKMYQLADFNIRVVSGVLKQAQSAKKLNTATQEQVEEAKAEYQTAQVKKIRAKTEYLFVLDKLCHDSGMAVSSLSGLRENITVHLPKPHVLAYWEKRALQGNLKVKLAALNVAIKNQRVGAAKGELIPKVKGLAVYSWSNDNGVTHIQDKIIPLTLSDHLHIRGGFVGISAAMPIFAGGALMHRISEQQYRYQKARIQLDNIKHLIRLKTRNDYRQLVADKQIMSAKKAAILSDTLAINMAMDQAKSGSATTFHVLQLEAKRLLAQQQLARAITEYIERWVTLLVDDGSLNAASIREINQQVLHD